MPKPGTFSGSFTGGTGGGPTAVYEIDNEQYVATVTPNAVWAFKLGGTLPPLEAVSRPPQEGFVGQIVETNQIETASLIRDTGFTGFHYMTDEHAFAPYRARVKVGQQVTWRNNGRLVHTVVAQDGSWTTGPLNTADVGGMTFKQPGAYAYMCKEHPWAVGEIIVVKDE
jgi:plastocyanin